VKASLTGFIMEQWQKDGKPSLSPDQLLRRTIAADEELEKMGLNPAPAFRRHRSQSDHAHMERYVAGFYEYEFAPNFKPRKRAKGYDVLAATPRVQVPATVTNAKAVGDLITQKQGDPGVTKNIATEAIGEKTYVKVPEEQLKPGTIDLVDGQTGISYQKLFGAYLRGAKSVTLIDPYIRFGYQIRNLMEFCKCLSPGKTSELELVTAVESREDEVQLLEKLDELKQSLDACGVKFKYQIDNKRHDREIRTDNGWRILLGRGLDIFQRPSGRFSLDTIDQSQRRCKATTITYLRV
jgi:hypothetical protein